jgi:5-formyltetrahydrofolate cyclo-ligase
MALEPGAIDVVVVPGLAFDPAGNRVGYGGGHYDRYLRRLARSALRVGICFPRQLVPEVPHGEGDEPVDLVVTGTVVTGPRAGRTEAGTEARPAPAEGT